MIKILAFPRMISQCNGELVLKVKTLLAAAFCVLVKREVERTTMVMMMTMPPMAPAYHIPMDGAREAERMRASQILF